VSKKKGKKEKDNIASNEQSGEEGGVDVIKYHEGGRASRGPG